MACVRRNTVYNLYINIIYQGYNVNISLILSPLCPELFVCLARVRLITITGREAIRSDM